MCEAALPTARATTWKANAAAKGLNPSPGLSFQPLLQPLPTGLVGLPVWVLCSVFKALIFFHRISVLWFCQLFISIMILSEFLLVYKMALHPFLS